jgi:hypothetical protein
MNIKPVHIEMKNISLFSMRACVLDILEHIVFPRKNDRA